ncbi:hypothetical protein K4Q74_11715 [Staphylococcus epidermidis]|nr:hypothetical protein [Staphylococcus epidermidis]
MQQNPEKRIHNKRHSKMTNLGKQRQYISREKTPTWLENPIYENKTKDNDDPQFEKERAAFLKQLEVD